MQDFFDFFLELVVIAFNPHSPKEEDESPCLESGKVSFEPVYFGAQLITRRNLQQRNDSRPSQDPQKGG